MMENNDPLISVIMPVYNGERFLRPAIDSILRQTFSDFELIIINDGSVDATEKIIQSYDDSRIRYVKNEYNLKLIKTLNKGLTLATGKYISRMDADDIADKYLFEKQIAAISADTSIDIVNISTYELREDGKAYRLSAQVLDFMPKTLKYVEMFENKITHPGIMVKADLMKQFKYKDDGSVVNFEDVDLWIRMLSHGCKCVTIKDRLLYYRINNSSITRTIGSKRNVLRTQYLSQLLDDNFGIKVADGILYYLYGDVHDGICKPNRILELMGSLEQTMNDDVVVIRQFRSWYHLRLVIVSIQIIKSHKFHLKVKALGFLLSHLNFMLDRTFLSYMKMKFNNKWMPYESINAR